MTKANDILAATLSVRPWGKTQVIYVVTYPNGDVIATHNLAAALKAVRRAACAVAGNAKAKGA